ncbi:hypothetical protein ASD65_12755 [Microbacterium sp. Root61]|uniref:hypothetical protein n=1 Tax=Microbacterium sp. Root61 TaxID=1736570 RepID=UPI0006F5D4AE|nr:hypothetical protein [Microbacterium sp. Root61]KRA25195.1 hypothetical protein ASD65_12755 [Microbacterium sp. Root61]
MLAAAGVFVALGWILLTAALGWGASFAHADDDTDRGGLLGAVTGLVDDTVSAVTGVATGAVQTATTAVVTPVVQTVTTVVPPAAPLVSTVTDTVRAVTAPVRQLVDTGVVSDIVDPVVAVVGAVPVVGKLVTTLGVDNALTDVAGTVDGTLSGVVGTVDGSVGTIVPPITGIPGVVVPGSPSDGTVTAGVPTGVALAIGNAPTFVGGDAGAPGHRRDAWWPSTAGVAVTAVSAATPLGGAAHSSSSPPGLCAPWGGSSTGSGGTGPGAAALLAFGPFVAHRAWVRRRGWTDDDAPTAPTLATDVSPD